MSLLVSDFYKHLLVNSTDLLTIIDEEGLYKYIGESMEQWLGYKPEELVGKSAFDLVHPDDLPDVLEAFQHIAVREKMQVGPFRYMSKFNGWRWLECTASNQTSNENIRGYITNSRDITETIEERTQKDLHQAYYKSLFEEHPDAVFSLNAEGYFQSVNRQFCRILGYSEDTMLHTHFTDFVQQNYIDLLNNLFYQTLGGQPQSLDIEVVDATQLTKIVQVTLLPVYLRKRVIGVQGIAKDITEAVSAQRQIKYQSEQFRKILESVTEPFFALDANWNYTFANQTYCDLLKKPAEQIKGANIWQLYPELVGTGFYNSCLKVAATGKTEYLEESYSAYNQAILSYSIFPFDGGIAIHFIDITAQASLKRELEKLSLVASKTINGVVIMDADCKIEWVNDGFTRLTGYTREEASGLVPGDLLQGRETDPAMGQYMRAKYKEEVPFTAEILNYRKTGEPYWVKVDVTPVKDARGKLLNYIAIQTDITEKKKAESELIKLADSLYKQNLNLQQFTYMVSHNLRAPVANALGLTRLINVVPAGTAQFTSILEKLQSSVSQLDTVIKDISKILSVRDAGKTIPREPVNLLAIFREVLMPFQDELRECDATVTLDVDHTFVLSSNKAYLYSVFQNLISNAIKYRSPERPLHLTINAKRDARGYEVNITDNGMGMDMQVVENQLFKLYKRFHPSIKGKGIGLFLVKTQLETLGGKILVSSVPGKGTTFTLLLGVKHV